MIKSDEVFYIGKITKYRGISGEVELQFTDDAFDRGRADYLVMEVDGIFVPFFWEEYRFKNDDTAIVKFEDVDNEKEAKKLVGMRVFYPYSYLDEDDNAELSSIRAITGFHVSEVNFGDLGMVVHVDDSSANVLLTIESEDGKEYIIPFHNDFLVDFDLKARILRLSLPKGILEINQ